MSADRDDVLAGELVLGVLTADEEAAALRRAEEDAAFAAEVAWWEEALSRIASEVGASVVRIFTAYEVDGTSSVAIWNDVVGTIREMSKKLPPVVSSAPTNIPANNDSTARRVAIANTIATIGGARLSQP